MDYGGFQHDALIYEGLDAYLAGTIPFLQVGIEAGQPVLVAVGPDKTESLKRELGADARRVRFAEMREVGRNPASIIPIWRAFADEADGEPVRGVGEPIWADRSAAALDECQRHEALLNVAFDRGPAWSLLCPYDAASLDDKVLEQVSHSHPAIHRDGRSEESRSFVSEPDCFAGELPPPDTRAATVTFELNELGEVRRHVAAAAVRAGMDRAGVADFVTAASEIAANSALHGGGSGTLRLWCEGEHLVAEIEDRGRIEDPLAGRVRPTASQEGGRGLWLANQLCDLVQIRSGSEGTVVRLHVATTICGDATLHSHRAGDATGL